MSKLQGGGGRGRDPGGRGKKGGQRGSNMFRVIIIIVDINNISNTAIVNSVGTIVNYVGTIVKYVGTIIIET